MENLKNVKMELALLGALYSNPLEYVNYGKMINKDLDFSDSYNKFLYDKFETYFLRHMINTNVTEISKTQFNLFIFQNEKDKEKYEKLGGFDFIQKMMAMTDAKMIEAYFDEVRKWTIIRMLKEKGFPVAPIINNPKFEKLTSHHLIQIMQNNLANISELAMGKEGLEILTDGLQDLVKECLETPYVGRPFKYQRYTDYMLGKKPGDLFMTVGFVNQGKSRESMSMIAHDALIDNQKILVLDNEMSVKKSKFALLTTILNDKVFGYNLNIPERNIKLGQYRNEAEKKKVLEVARIVEDACKDKIFFKQLHDYSDKNIEFEIRKAKMAKDIDMVNYGTLQSQGKDRSDWSALITTTSMLKTLSEELGIFTMTQAQLTLDSDDLSIFDISFKNIGESKGIVKVADFAVARLELTPEEKAEVQIENKKGEKVDLPYKDKRWYGAKFIKNREGPKPVLVNMVDLDLNTWSEMTELYKSKIF